MNKPDIPPTPHQHPTSGTYSLQLQEDTVDLKKYFFLILANWYWFIIAIFLGLAVAYLINRYSKPVYQVRASLVINDDIRSGGLSGYEAMLPGMEIYRTRTLVTNEVEILKSYTIAKRALQELDFDITYVGVGRSGLKENYQYHNAPFYIVPDTSETNLTGRKVKVELFSKTEYRVSINDNYEISEVVKYGEPFKSGPFNFTLHLKDPINFDPPGYDSYYFVINSLNSLANRYRGKLNIEVNDDRRGSVLFLSTSGLNSQQEADYINKLMEVYIDMGLEEKNQTATNTVEFIDEQLGVIDDSLQDAELTLQEFRLENDLIDVTAEGKIIYDKLERLDREKAQLELRTRYFDYLKEYIQNQNNLNEVVAPATFDISDPLLNSLIGHLNEQLAEKEELLFTIQEGSSRLVLINRKIENTRKAILDNINGLITNNEIASQKLDQQLNEARNELQQLPVTERQLISIQREYKVNDQIYTYLLQKRAEAAIARASNVADNKILDPARSENAQRTAPNTKMNYMMGLILGIGLPLSLLILMDLLNNKITSRSDIENKINVPIVAHIGHSVSGDIPVFENPKSSLAESFRGLRTNLQYLLRDKDKKIITVSSTISGEGKTFVSLNLAAIFALAGKKTLLVGLDLRKPKIHKVFNLDNSKGLSLYLIGKLNYEELFRTTEISNLNIVPSGPVPPNPAELLETEKMQDFIKQIRKDFDIIIFDTPPFGVVTDALLLGRHSDASMFLVRQNYSNKDIVSLINEIRERQDLNNLGIVFNDLKMRGYYSSGYKYYNYNYTYKYGYLYGSDYYGEK